MKTLHSRTDLLKLAKSFCGTTACERYLELGDVKVYGLFKFPDSTLVPHGWQGECGWMLEVMGLGATWLIAIRPDPNTQKYKGCWPDEIPWECWQGSVGGMANIQNGDDPLAYGLLKAKARRRLK